jgi:hypothetical protein
VYPKGITVGKKRKEKKMMCHVTGGIIDQINSSLICR